MNLTLITLLIALAVGIFVDVLITKGTKISWLGTLVGFAAFGVVAIVGLGLV